MHKLTTPEQIFDVNGARFTAKGLDISYEYNHISFDGMTRTPVFTGYTTYHFKCIGGNALHELKLRFCKHTISQTLKHIRIQGECEILFRCLPPDFEYNFATLPEYAEEWQFESNS